MRFISYYEAGDARTGVINNDEVVDMAALNVPGITQLQDLIDAGSDGLAAVAQALQGGDYALKPLTELKLLAPVATSGKNIFCIGRNFFGHVQEGYKAQGLALDVPKVPQIFTKPRTSLAASGEDLSFRKKVSDRMDYEGELGIIIAKGGRDIKPENAFDHIFGYTVINDITARDLQRKHDQWFKGKGLDQSCPMGPWIITKDEVTDIQTVEILTTVNGETRQSAKVSQMIFDIPTILAELSRGMTLEAGDIIATGTPEGVGYAMATPQYLKNGDIVTVAISGVGELTNRITIS
ncbi:fumarylacetoacetate hydrolase family protein [Kordiimonas pumila]|uniref:Fumarylacetoacetate hydrolase family protein n=1 Tax=Kordiimonas pumila TaxID=2161677 RepID=A0ABV7D2N0_9PROT|nr:fumarylacetoacetate hydrolase family protein [Kordiimonas pumila]